jgi:lactate dehydrogenase-like 2-hydroxyacid dehydrogenase
MSGKERVVFLDRAAFTADDLPIPAFDHSWSEYPDTEPADVVPRLFWATMAITHACPLDAAAIGQLHKLKRIVVTGPAAVDAAACAARGVTVARLPPDATCGPGLVRLLETLVEGAAP